MGVCGGKGGGSFRESVGTVPISVDTRVSLMLRFRENAVTMECGKELGKEALIVCREVRAWRASAMPWSENGTTNGMIGFSVGRGIWLKPCPSWCEFSLLVQNLSLSKRWALSIAFDPEGWGGKDSSRVICRESVVHRPLLKCRPTLVGFSVLMSERCWWNLALKVLPVSPTYPVSQVSQRMK